MENKMPAYRNDIRVSMYEPEKGETKKHERGESKSFERKEKDVKAKAKNKSKRGKK